MSGNWKQKDRMLASKCYKVDVDYIEFDTTQKDLILDFQKESVENTELYKPVLNKRMTTHK